MGVKRSASKSDDRSVRILRGKRLYRYLMSPLIVILIAAVLMPCAYSVPVTGGTAPLPTVSTTGTDEYKPGDTTPEAVPTPDLSVSEEPEAVLPQTPANDGESADPAVSSLIAFIEENYFYLGGALILLLLSILIIRIAGSRKKVLAAKYPAKSAGAVTSAVLQNQGSYKEQEDSYYLSKSSDPDFLAGHGVLAAVADGMGGLSNGAQVSELVTSVLSQLFLQTQADMDPSDKLMYMAHRANSEVCARFGSKPGQSGSTLVAAIVKGGYLWLLSVGDSRVALVRNGGLIQLNREHTYAADLDELAARGEISYSDAAFDSQRRALTSYIGMGELEHIDTTTKPIKLLPGDFILLMSDGVSNELTDQEIIDALSADLDASAKALETAVLSKKDPRQDNFTALLLRYI